MKTDFNLQNSKNLDRVVVIGTSGAGKSTFASSLASLLQVPHYEIDRLFWKPGWKQTPDSELLPRIQTLAVKSFWVFDGNYSRLQPIIWPRATALVWLNYPFYLVFYRVLIRTMERVLSKEEVFPGCFESFQNSFFSKDSLLWWVITTHQRRRRKYRKIFDLNEYPDLEKIEITSPFRADLFLETLSKNLPFIPSKNL